MKAFAVLLALSVLAFGANNSVTYDTGTGEIVQPTQLKIKTANAGSLAAPAITFGSNSHGIYWASGAGGGVTISENGVKILNFDSAVGMIGGTGLGITLTGGGIFTGDGSGLTALNAGNLSAGTIATGRISGSYSGITGVGTLTGGTWNATTIGAQWGGTGNASYTIGDILYASGTTALSRLSGVATGNALISGGVGTAPSWGKIGLTTHVSGTLAVGSGGSGTTTATGTAGNVVLSIGPTLTGATTVDTISPSSFANAKTTRENFGLVTKYKASATARVNNTRSADPDIGSHSINSGEAWEFEYVVYWKCNVSGATPGFSVGLTGPTGTIRYGAIAGSIMESSGIVGGAPVIDVFADPILNMTAPGTDNYYLRIRGTIIATSTATLTFKWAQVNTDAANATTVQAGSFAKFTRLN